MTIYTFGYGNRTSYDDLEKYIDECPIHYLVDVRVGSKAWSRKWWGDKVKEFCEGKGINYLWEPTLGNTSGKPNWIPPDFDEALASLERLNLLLEEGDTNMLLMCAEKDYQKCHRTIVLAHLITISGHGGCHLA